MRVPLIARAASVLLGLAVPAHAEVGVSAALESDDRLRGVSLSDGNPVFSLNVSYDHKSGIYGGVSATAVATDHSGVEMLGDVAYIGYARKIDAVASWDV
ncbi:MAG TPA: TorF family putative porin, partial [Caulobacteraceae bacterium]